MKTKIIIRLKKLICIMLICSLLVSGQGPLFGQVVEAVNLKKAQAESEQAWWVNNVLNTKYELRVNLQSENKEKISDDLKKKYQYPRAGYPGYDKEYLKSENGEYKAKWSGKRENGDEREKGFFLEIALEGGDWSDGGKLKRVISEASVIIKRGEKPYEVPLLNPKAQGLIYEISELRKKGYLTKSLTDAAEAWLDKCIESGRSPFAQRDEIGKYWEVASKLPLTSEEENRRNASVAASQKRLPGITKIEEHQGYYDILQKKYRESDYTDTRIENIMLNILDEYKEEIQNEALEVIGEAIGDKGRAAISKKTTARMLKAIGEHKEEITVAYNAAFGAEIIKHHSRIEETWRVRAQAEMPKKEKEIESEFLTLLDEKIRENLPKVLAEEIEAYRNQSTYKHIDFTPGEIIKVLLDKGFRTIGRPEDYLKYFENISAGEALWLGIITEQDIRNIELKVNAKYLQEIYEGVLNEIVDSKKLYEEAVDKFVDTRKIQETVVEEYVAEHIDTQALSKGVADKYLKKNIEVCGESFFCKYKDANTGEEKREVITHKNPVLEAIEEFNKWLTESGRGIRQTIDDLPFWDWTWTWLEYHAKNFLNNTEVGRIAMATTVDFKDYILGIGDVYNYNLEKSNWDAKLSPGRYFTLGDGILYKAEEISLDRKLYPGKYYYDGKKFFNSIDQMVQITWEPDIPAGEYIFREDGSTYKVIEKTQLRKNNENDAWSRGEYLVYDDGSIYERSKNKDIIGDVLYKLAPSTFRGPSYQENKKDLKDFDNKWLGWNSLGLTLTEDENDAREEFVKAFMQENPDTYYEKDDIRAFFNINRDALLKHAEAINIETHRVLSKEIIPARQEALKKLLRERFEEAALQSQPVDAEGRWIQFDNSSASIYVEPEHPIFNENLSLEEARKYGLINDEAEQQARQKAIQTITGEIVQNGFDYYIRNHTKHNMDNLPLYEYIGADLDYKLACIMNISGSGKLFNLALSDDYYSSYQQNKRTIQFYEAGTEFTWLGDVLNKVALPIVVDFFLFKGLGSAAGAALGTTGITGALMSSEWLQAMSLSLADGATGLNAAKTPFYLANMINGALSTSGVLSNYMGLNSYLNQLGEDQVDYDKVRYDFFEGAFSGLIVGVAAPIISEAVYYKQLSNAPFRTIVAEDITGITSDQMYIKPLFTSTTSLGGNMLQMGQRAGINALGGMGIGGVFALSSVGYNQFNNSKYSLLSDRQKTSFIHPDSLDLTLRSVLEKAIIFHIGINLPNQGLHGNQSYKQVSYQMGTRNNLPSYEVLGRRWAENDYWEQKLKSIEGHKNKGGLEYNAEKLISQTETSSGRYFVAEDGSSYNVSEISVSGKKLPAGKYHYNGKYFVNEKGEKYDGPARNSEGGKLSKGNYVFYEDGAVGKVLGGARKNLPLSEYILDKDGKPLNVDLETTYVYAEDGGYTLSIRDGKVLKTRQGARGKASTVKVNFSELPQELQGLLLKEISTNLTAQVGGGNGGGSGSSGISLAEGISRKDINGKSYIEIHRLDDGKIQAEIQRQNDIHSKIEKGEHIRMERADVWDWNRSYGYTGRMPRLSYLNLTLRFIRASIFLGAFTISTSPSALSMLTANAPAQYEYVVQGYGSITRNTVNKSYTPGTMYRAPLNEPAFKSPLNSSENISPARTTITLPQVIAVPPYNPGNDEYLSVSSNSMPLYSSPLERMRVSLSAGFSPEAASFISQTKSGVLGNSFLVNDKELGPLLITAGHAAPKVGELVISRNRYGRVITGIVISSHFDKDSDGNAVPGGTDIAFIRPLDNISGIKPFKFAFKPAQFGQTISISGRQGESNRFFTGTGKVSAFESEYSFKAGTFSERIEEGFSGTPLTGTGRNKIRVFGLTTNADDHGNLLAFGTEGIKRELSNLKLSTEPQSRQNNLLGKQEGWKPVSIPSTQPVYETQLARRVLSADPNDPQLLKIYNDYIFSAVKSLEKLETGTAQYEAASKELAAARDFMLRAGYKASNAYWLGEGEDKLTSVPFFYNPAGGEEHLLKAMAFPMDNAGQNYMMFSLRQRDLLNTALKQIAEGKPVDLGYHNEFLKAVPLLIDKNLETLKQFPQELLGKVLVRFSHKGLTTVLLQHGSARAAYLAEFGPELAPVYDYIIGATDTAPVEAAKKLLATMPDIGLDYGPQLRNFAIPAAGLWKPVAMVMPASAFGGFFGYQPSLFPEDNASRLRENLRARWNETLDPLHEKYNIPQSLIGFARNYFDMPSAGSNNFNIYPIVRGSTATNYDEIDAALKKATFTESYFPSGLNIYRPAFFIDFMRRFEARPPSPAHNRTTEIHHITDVLGYLVSENLPPEQNHGKSIFDLDMLGFMSRYPHLSAQKGFSQALSRVRAPLYSLQTFNLDANQTAVYKNIMGRELHNSFTYSPMPRDHKKYYELYSSAFDIASILKHGVKDYFTVNFLGDDHNGALDPKHVIAQDRVLSIHISNKNPESKKHMGEVIRALGEKVETTLRIVINAHGNKEIIDLFDENGNIAEVARVISENLPEGKHAEILITSCHGGGARDHIAELAAMKNLSFIILADKGTTNSGMPELKTRNFVQLYVETVRSKWFGATYINGPMGKIYQGVDFMGNNEEGKALSRYYAGEAGSEEALKALGLMTDKRILNISVASVRIQLDGIISKLTEDGLLEDGVSPQIPLFGNGASWRPVSQELTPEYVLNSFPNLEKNYIEAFQLMLPPYENDAAYRLGLLKLANEGEDFSVSDAVAERNGFLPYSEMEKMSKEEIDEMANIVAETLGLLRPDTHYGTLKKVKNVAKIIGALPYRVIRSVFNGRPRDISRTIKVELKTIKYVLGSLDAGKVEDSFISGSVKFPHANLDAEKYNVLLLNDHKSEINQIIRNHIDGDYRSSFIWDYATSIKEGKEIIRNNPNKYDFVLVDLHFFNGSNGFSFAKWLQGGKAGLVKKPALISIASVANKGRLPELLARLGFDGSYAYGKDINYDEYLAWFTKAKGLSSERNNPKLREGTDVPANQPDWQPVSLNYGKIGRDLQRKFGDIESGVKMPWMDPRKYDYNGEYLLLGIPMPSLSNPNFIQQFREKISKGPQYSHFIYTSDFRNATFHATNGEEFTSKNKNYTPLIFTFPRQGTEEWLKPIRHSLFGDYESIYTLVKPVLPPFSVIYVNTMDHFWGRSNMYHEFILPQAKPMRDEWRPVSYEADEDYFFSDPLDPARSWSEGVLQRNIERANAQSIADYEAREAAKIYTEIRKLAEDKGEDFPEYALKNHKEIKEKILADIAKARIAEDGMAQPEIYHGKAAGELMNIIFPLEKTGFVHTESYGPIVEALIEYDTGIAWRYSSGKFDYGARVKAREISAQSENTASTLGRQQFAEKEWYVLRLADEIKDIAKEIDTSKVTFLVLNDNSSFLDSLAKYVKTAFGRGVSTASTLADLAGELRAFRNSSKPGDGKTLVILTDMLMRGFTGNDVIKMADDMLPDQKDNILKILITGGSYFEYSPKIMYNQGYNGMILIPEHTPYLRYYIGYFLKKYKLAQLKEEAVPSVPHDVKQAETKTYQLVLNQGDGFADWLAENSFMEININLEEIKKSFLADLATLAPDTKNISASYAAWYKTYKPKAVEELSSVLKALESTPAVNTPDYLIMRDGLMAADMNTANKYMAPNNNLPEVDGPFGNKNFDEKLWTANGVDNNYSRKVSLENVEILRVYGAQDAEKAEKVLNRWRQDIDNGVKEARVVIINTSIEGSAADDIIKAIYRILPDEAGNILKIPNIGKEILGWGKNCVELFKRGYNGRPLARYYHGISYYSSEDDYIAYALYNKGMASLTATEAARVKNNIAFEGVADFQTQGSPEENLRRFREIWERTSYFLHIRYGASKDMIEAVGQLLDKPARAYSTHNSPIAKFAMEAEHILKQNIGKNYGNIELIAAQAAAIPFSESFPENENIAALAVFLEFVKLFDADKTLSYAAMQQVIRDMLEYILSAARPPEAALQTAPEGQPDYWRPVSQVLPLAWTMPNLGSIPFAWPLTPVQIVLPEAAPASADLRGDINQYLDKDPAKICLVYDDMSKLVMVKYKDKASKDSFVRLNNGAHHLVYENGTFIKTLNKIIAEKNKEAVDYNKELEKENNRVKKLNRSRPGAQHEPLKTGFMTMIPQISTGDIPAIFTKVHKELPHNTDQFGIYAERGLKAVFETEIKTIRALGGEIDFALEAEIMRKARQFAEKYNLIWERPSEWRPVSLEVNTPPAPAGKFPGEILLNNIGDYGLPMTRMPNGFVLGPSFSFLPAIPVKPKDGIVFRGGTRSEESIFNVFSNDLRIPRKKYGFNSWSTREPSAAAGVAIERLDRDRNIPVVLHINSAAGWLMSGGENAAYGYIPKENILKVSTLLNIGGGLQWGSIRLEDNKLIFKPYSPAPFGSPNAKNFNNSANRTGPYNQSGWRPVSLNDGEPLLADMWYERHGIRTKELTPQALVKELKRQEKVWEITNREIPLLFTDKGAAFIKYISDNPQKIEEIFLTDIAQARHIAEGMDDLSGLQYKSKVGGELSQIIYSLVKTDFINTPSYKVIAEALKDFDPGFLFEFTSGNFNIGTMANVRETSSPAANTASTLSRQEFIYQEWLPESLQNEMKRLSKKVDLSKVHFLLVSDSHTVLSQIYRQVGEFFSKGSSYKSVYNPEEAKAAIEVFKAASKPGDGNVLVIITDMNFMSTYTGTDIIKMADELLPEQKDNILKILCTGGRRYTPENMYKAGFNGMYSTL